MSRLTPEAAALVEGIKVIDVDTHWSEPHDLWTSRAPAAIRDRVPQVKPVNGYPTWVIDGDKSIGSGRGSSPISAIRRDGSKPVGLGFFNWQLEDVHRGAHELGPRLEVMDEHGIHAQVVYPNLLGFGGQKAAKVDPGLRLSCTQIFNDAMAELQTSSGQRMFPMTLLPWWDVKLSVAETLRMQKAGARGININSDPHGHDGLDGRRLPDLADPYWDPLWEVCNEYRLPVNFHIGASEQTMNWAGSNKWPSHDPEIAMVISSTLLFTNNGRVMSNLLLSGIPDRFPNIRFVSVESGLGWVPFLLEALDYQFSENVTSKRFSRKPSEYFRDHFYTCFWFENRDIAHMIHAVGVDNVMFESDFPHPTCLYPDPIERGAKALAGLDREARAKVMSGNAAKLYSIPVAG